MDYDHYFDYRTWAYYFWRYGLAGDYRINGYASRIERREYVARAATRDTN